MWLHCELAIISKILKVQKSCSIKTEKCDSGINFFRTLILAEISAVFSLYFSGFIILHFNMHLLDLKL